MSCHAVIWSIVNVCSPVQREQCGTALSVTEKQYLAGTSCLLLRFPSLAITYRPSWCNSTWMTGKREPSSPSGVLYQVSQFEHKCCQETSLPLKGLVFAHSCSSHWSYMSLGEKKILSAHSDTVTTATRYRPWHLPRITAVYGRTAPDGKFKIPWPWKKLESWRKCCTLDVRFTDQHGQLSEPWNDKENNTHWEKLYTFEAGD